MEAHRLQGLAVISLGDAERIGRVQDIVFETSPLSACALRLATDVGPRLVSLWRIRSVRADAIVVEDWAAGDASDRSLRTRELPTLTDLERLRVVDERGTYLGRVAGLDLDTLSGAVSSIAVEGGLPGAATATTTFSVDQLVSLGPELLTVRTAA